MKEGYYRFEEDFHDKDRKLNRRERKIAVAKDRSQFKKSDQDQLKKRAVAPTIPEGLLRGRVLAITPEGMVVDSDHRQYTCTLKGSLKQDKGPLKNLVAVGDFVHFSTEGVVALVEERTSILSRADNLSRNKQQLIAVNIDQVLITTSVLFPPLKPFLIDRYIIAALKGNMQPLIVINKIDLLDSPPPDTDPVLLEEQRALYHDFLQAYRELPLFPVSTKTGEGIAELKSALRGKASVFSGQSGVGKSSLINAMLGSQLATGKIVEKTSKGSHTTTTAQLLPLEGDGFCIDTPGIKSFGVWDLTSEEIQTFFPEILEASYSCKFRGCSHLQEPGCAVIEALEEGRISPLRFASFCALINSLKTEHRNR
jgi:ribosome biogenesis GTPase